MNTTQEPEEISNLTKFILLAGVSLLILLVFGVFLFITRNNDHEPKYYNCETFYDSTPCPEPDYEEGLDKQIMQYPDDSY